MGRSGNKLLTPPSVHFIIPSFKGEKTIQKCLEAIAAQDYPSERIEISVIENGSRTIDTEILKKFPNCNYYFNTIKGRSQARNFLLGNVSTNFIAFVDVDVRLDKKWLKQCIENMQSPFCAAVSGPIFRRGSGWLDHFRKKTSEITTNNQCNTMENPFTLGCLNTAAVLIRTPVIKNLNGFDNSFVRSEDHELTQRILRSGYIVSTTAHATAEVYWDRGLFEYFFIRSFEMGFYSAKSNIAHGLENKNILNLTTLKSFNKFADRLCWLLTHLCFVIGYKIGTFKHSDLKQWTPEVIQKKCVILKNGDSQRLGIYEFNPKWEVVNIRNNIHLFHRKTGKIYRLKDEANDMITALMNNASYPVKNEREQYVINCLEKDQILRLIHLP